METMDKTATILQDGMSPCVCSCNNHTIFGWKRSGFLVASLCSIFTLAVVIPYIVVISKETMPAFLPFISQVGGSPPTTGIFGCFLSFGGFIGFITSFLIYETIRHRNTKKLEIIKHVNKIGRIIMWISSLGSILTACFPIGYTQVPNKFEWVITVFLEHGSGAIMILFGMALYQFCISAIWFFLPDVTKKSRNICLAFSFGFLILFLISVKPMPDYLYEELGPEPFNIPLLKNTTYELPLVFSVTYNICASCEWLACVIMISFFATLYKDLQRISFRVVLRPKSCFDSWETSSKLRLKSLSMP